MKLKAPCLGAAILAVALAPVHSATAGARSHPSKMSSRYRKAASREPAAQEPSSAPTRESSPSKDNDASSTRVGTDAEIEIKGEGLPYAPYERPQREDSRAGGA